MAININAKVMLNTDNYKNGLTNMQNITKRTTTTIQQANNVVGDSFKSVTKDIVNMGTAFITFDRLIDFWKQSYIEAEKTRKEALLFESVMNNTGRAYKNATKELKDYASALEQKTGKDDGDILQIEQKFALIENLTTNLIPRATKASLDWSVAMGSDMTSASNALAKALEDPLDSLSSLRRAGILLSDEQEDIIKSLAESGKTYEAQVKLIEELEKKVGGLSEKNKSTLDDFKTEWKNFLEEYGQDTKLVFEEKVIPVLSKVLLFFKMLSGMSGESITSANSWDKIFGVTELSAGVEELSKAEKKVQEIKKKLENLDGGIMRFLPKKTKEKVKKEFEDDLKSAENRVKTLKKIEEQTGKGTKKEETNEFESVDAKGEQEKKDKEKALAKKKNAEKQKEIMDKFYKQIKKDYDKAVEENIRDIRKNEEDKAKELQKYNEEYKQYYLDIQYKILDEKEIQAQKEKEIENQKAKDLLEINVKYFEDLYELNNNNKKEQDDLIKQGSFFQLESLKRENEIKKEELRLQKEYDTKKIKEGDKFNTEQEYEKLQSSIKQLEIQKNQYIEEDIYRKNADEAFIMGKQALNNITGMLLNDWIMGEWKGLEEYSRILTYQLQQELASMAQRNAIKALEQTAIGLAFLAVGNAPQASLAFKSATAFATTAVTAGAGSFAVGSANRALGGKPNQNKEDTSKAVSRTTEEKKVIENKTEQQEFIVISKNDYQKYVRSTLLPEIQKALDAGKTLRVK